MSGHGPQDGPAEAPGAVAPGWYYDAATGGQRWWSGTGWTEHTQAGADPSVAVQPPVRMVALRNPSATAGLVLGLIALVVNTLAVVSVVGIALSWAGLVKANRLLQHGYAPVGRQKAIAGLVLSGLALFFTATAKAFLF